MAEPTCKRCGHAGAFSPLRPSRWALVNPHMPEVVHYPAGTMLCSGCEEIGRPKAPLPVSGREAVSNARQG